MERYFNLITEQWIPVIYTDGSTDRVGWRDLIANSKDIQDISTDPVHFYGILIRFATALFLRTQAAPLANPSPLVWQSWGKEKLERGINTEDLKSYLEKWVDHFWLIDDIYPFLQDPDIKNECSERDSTNKICFDVASGNNLLWWTKIPDKDAAPISFATAALAIMGQWAYAAGGRCTSRNNVSDSQEGPLRKSSQFIPRGANLLETLLMCCTPAPLDYEYAKNDAPVWELKPSYVLVPGQLGRLTASTKGILLFQKNGAVEKVVITWGKNKVENDFWDADTFTAKKIVNGKNQDPFLFQPFDAVWQEAPSIMANNSDHDNGKFIPPLVLDPTRNPLGSTDIFLTSGITVLTHFHKRAKDTGWNRSDLPGILAAHQMKYPDTFQRVSQFCNIAVEIIKKVEGVLDTKKSIAHSHDPIVSDVTMLIQSIWSEAEQQFYNVLNGESWEKAGLNLIKFSKNQFDLATKETAMPQRLAVIFQKRRNLSKKLQGIVKKFGIELMEIAK